MGRPGLELGEIGKVRCFQGTPDCWIAEASYRGDGGHVKRYRRWAPTKEEAIERLHAACANAGASSWMKLPPPPPITPEQISPGRPRRKNVPTTLYRFFDQDGALLYIGISADVRRRISQHRKDKPWWKESARIEMEHYPNAEEARAAEKIAIKTENPRHNVADVSSEDDTESYEWVIVEHEPEVDFTDPVERVRHRYRTDPAFRQMIRERSGLG